MDKAMRVAAAIAVLGAVGACGTGQADSGADDRGESASVVGSVWRIDSVTEEGKKTPVRGSLRISEDGKAVLGGACNGGMGPASVGDGWVRFDGFSTTLKACNSENMATNDRHLHRALEGKMRSEVNGDRLTLSKAERVTVRLSLVVDTSLTGTKWVAHTLYGRAHMGGSLPEGVEVSMRFGQDGSVKGRVGCNTFEGRALIKEKTITFSDLMQTDKRCASDVKAVEEHLWNVLSGVVTREQRGTSLTIQKGSEVRDPNKGIGDDARDGFEMTAKG